MEISIIELSVDPNAYTTSDLAIVVIDGQLGQGGSSIHRYVVISGSVKRKLCSNFLEAYYMRA